MKQCGRESEGGVDAQGSILCLVPHLEAGGAERVLVNLANHWICNGTSVTFAVIKVGGVLQKGLDSRVEIVSLGGRRASRSVWPLSKILRERAVTVIFVMKTYLLPVALVAKGIARCKAPVVYREVVLKSAALGEEGRRILQAKWFLRYLYRRVPQIVVPAHEMRTDLTLRFGVDPARVVVIPNPVDLRNIRARTQVRPSHPWFAEGEPPVVMGMGRLTRQKGFDILLDAFARLPADLKARLVILGSGPDQARLEAQARDVGIQRRVAFLGVLENPYSLMAAASVFVLSSRFEGFPNVLLEGMACGVPVIATDCPSGPSELVDDEESGVLVPVGDPEAMADAIERVLRDPVWAGKMAQSAKRRSQRFAADGVAQEFLQVLMPRDEHSQGS